MSNDKYEFIISAKDEATKTLKNVNDQVKQSTKSWKDGAKTAGKYGAVIGGAVLLAGKKFVSMANEQLRVEKQLDAVIKSTGGSAGVTAEEVKKMASELQNVTTIGDEATIAGTNMLLTFTQIGKDVLPQATETLLDMATAMNRGATPSAEMLSAQAIQLGKSLNDPITGVTALSRVGVKFTEEQKDQIKVLTESGKVMEAQKIILNELAVEFGGSARAQAQTFEGQMTQLSNTFGDIQEELGKALIPMLLKLSNVLKFAMQAYQELSPETQKAIALGIAFTGALAGVVAIVSGLTLVLAPLATAIAFLASPIGVVMGAMVALGIAYQQNVFGIRDQTEALVELFKIGWGNIQDSLALFLVGWNQQWAEFEQTLKNVWYGFVGIVETAVAGIRATIDGLFKAFDKVQRLITGSAETSITVNRAFTGVPSDVGLPPLARGGIVKNPTVAQIGEGGQAEAVVPLPGGRSIPVEMKGGGGGDVNIGTINIAKEVDADNFLNKMERMLTRKMQLQQLNSSSA